MQGRKARRAMKVLFVLNQLPENPDSNGTTRWFFNTIKPMRSLVDQIDVAEQAFGPIEKLAEIRKYCDHLFVVPPINHGKYRYKWFIGWDYSKVRAYNSAFIRLLQKLCDENLYDLIILVGHGAHVNIPYLRARHIMAAPLDAPSGVALDNSLRDLPAFAKTFLNKMVIRQSERSYNSADSVLVVSERDKELLIKSGVSTKIFVNPIGIDVTEFSPQSIHERTKALLFTGVLFFPPNVDASIHLVNDIYIPGKFYAQDIICRIAGRKPLQSIKDLGKTNGVEILEDVPDLRPVFDDSLVFVAPLRVGLGMKFKILEAMAMAKPIVGYPLAFNGINDPEQFALVCHSPDEVIHAINKLIHDNELQNDLGLKARKFVEDHYRLEQNTKAILDIAKR